MKDLMALKQFWENSGIRGSFNLELYYKYLKAIENK